MSFPASRPAFPLVKETHLLRHPEMHLRSGLVLDVNAVLRMKIARLFRRHDELLNEPEARVPSTQCSDREESVCSEARLLRRKIARLFLKHERKYDTLS